MKKIEAPPSMFILRHETRKDADFILMEDDMRWLEKITRAKRVALNKRLREYLNHIGIVLDGDILENANPKIRCY